MNYSISKIEEMVENEKFSTKMIPVVETLLSAVNDWSEPLDNFYDYEIAVVFNYAWEAESLSYIIEIYDYFEEGITLKEVIDKVMQEQSPE
jgi:hypothetical protein